MVRSLGRNRVISVVIWLKRNTQMVLRFLPLSALFLAAFGAIFRNDCLGADYSQMKRLQAVLELPSFPKPSREGIQTWLQKSSSIGVVNYFDFTKFPLKGNEELPLNTFVKFYDAKNTKTDLANVIIITDDGRTIRFLDFGNHNENFVVKRGDVVAFLVDEKAK